MSQDAVTARKDLSVVRDRRASLRRACAELEGAIASAPMGRADDWSRQVAPKLAAIRQAFDAHITITEGPDGLFDQIRADAPRLTGKLTRLHKDHDDITAQLAAADEGLAAHDEEALERARQLLTRTLNQLSRHRRRGADLLYQAYQVDIGGE